MNINCSGKIKDEARRIQISKELSDMGVRWHVVNDVLIANYYGDNPVAARRIIAIFETIPDRIIEQKM